MKSTSKYPGGLSEAEYLEKVKHERFTDERGVQLQYESIRRILRGIQVVQVIQSAAILVIASTLLLK